MYISIIQYILPFPATTTHNKFIKRLNVVDKTSVYVLTPYESSVLALLHLTNPTTAR